MEKPIAENVAKRKKNKDRRTSGTSEIVAIEAGRKPEIRSGKGTEKDAVAFAGRR